MIHFDKDFEKIRKRTRIIFQFHNIALLIAFVASLLVLFFLSGVKQLWSYIGRRRQKAQKNSEDPIASGGLQSQTRQNGDCFSKDDQSRDKRIRSLDVVRGWVRRQKSLETEYKKTALTKFHSRTFVSFLLFIISISILMMIFVNGGAAGYTILKHATWNGLAFGDLVFPCFMWIMGVCIPLSISAQFSRGTTKFNVCWPIIKVYHNCSIYLYNTIT